MTILARWNFPEGGKVNEPAAVALETLREHCSPEQRASLDAHGRFEAVGASGKRYMITVVGDTVTVEFENTRRRVAALVALPTWTATVRGRYRHLPPADCALLAKLSIEAAEEHWKGMAYMCGNVYVEDRNVYVEDRGPQEQAAEAATQQQIAEQRRFNQLAQAGQLVAGTTWVVANACYVWNGYQWERSV